MYIELEKPIHAIWVNQDYDLPVILIGIARYKDGKFFFSIKNSKTFIPYEELTFKEGEDPIENVINMV